MTTFKLKQSPRGAMWAAALMLAAALATAQTNPAGASLTGLTGSAESGLAGADNPAGAAVDLAGTDSAAPEFKSPRSTFAYAGLFDPHWAILDGPIDWPFQSFAEPENPSRFLLGQSAFVPANQFAITLTGAAFSDMGIAALDRTAPLGAQQDINIDFTVELMSGDAPPADGVALFLTATPYVTGGRGGWIGHNPGFGPSVSVEIDVMPNDAATFAPHFDDPPYQHVGINLNGSPISVATAPAPAALQNAAWRVWVEYYGAQRRMAVFLAPGGSPKPAVPLLTHAVDLPGRLGSEQLYVTIVGTTGELSQTQRLTGVAINNRTLDRNSVRVDWLSY